MSDIFDLPAETEIAEAIPRFDIKHKIDGWRYWIILGYSKNTVQQAAILKALQPGFIMNEIVIVPYVSAGEYKFNSTIKDIEKKLGPPMKALVDNIMNYTTEYRNAAEIIYEKRRSVYKIKSVVCTRHMNPIINGVSIFEAGLDAIKEMDDDFVDGPKYTAFKNLGILIGGMGTKKIPEKRLVIAFRKESLSFYEYFPLD